MAADETPAGARGGRRAANGGRLDSEKGGKPFSSVTCAAVELFSSSPAKPVSSAISGKERAEQQV
jgi:hypothetical protein